MNDLPQPATAAELYRLARSAPDLDGQLTRDDLLGLPYCRDAVPVALYRAVSDDGADVTVSVTRLPAMFYQIDCGPFRLQTGSGMEELAHQVAEALAGGMLAIKDDARAVND